MSSTPEHQIRALIADDRPWTRAGLRALLATRPEIALVGEATDGREVLALVERYRPDVVLLDVRMPNLDGLEATRRIKARWPEMRVVVLSMHAAYRSEALAAGANRFLVKGGPIRQLIETVLGLNGNESAEDTRRPGDA